MAATGRQLSFLPTRMSPYLWSVALCARHHPNSFFFRDFVPFRWRSSTPTPLDCSLGHWQCSSSLLVSRDMFEETSSSFLCMLNSMTRRRPWTRDNYMQFSKFRTTASALPNDAVFPGNVLQVTSTIPREFEDSVSEVRSLEQVKTSTINSASSRKSKYTCYYHTQGLCTMMEDPVHSAKFCHEAPDLFVSEEDQKKVKAQPFDYFLVLDLEGMVEILEFPVIMIDAKTLQVVDRFHRFVRPAKMSQERIFDYIRNKYGRWRLDRVWHDTAIPFADVLPVFERWLESHGLWDPQMDGGKLKSAAFVTCGNWDVKTKIPEQCATSEINLPPYFNEWVNLKDIFFNHYKFKATGMLKMMRGLKIPMVGTHHVGLDDAYNITRVLQKMIAQGALVQLTAKRKADDPKAVKFTFRFRIK